MSELVWSIKNGDIDQVKDIIENKVFINYSSLNLPPLNSINSSTNPTKIKSNQIKTLLYL